jgi:hypothetical protein
LNNETIIRYEKGALTGEYLRDLFIVANNIELMGAAIRGYKTDKKINGFVELINKEFEEYNGCHAVNVKMYDWIDMDDLIDKMNTKEHNGDYYLDKPITDLQKEWLNDKFDEQRQSDLWSFWVEMERECLIEYIKEDYPEFSLKDAKFDGRGGGHFCLCKIFEIEYDHKHPEDVISEILYEMDEKKFDVIEAEGYVDLVLENQENAFEILKETRKILTFVDKFVKRLDFGYEMAYRISETMREDIEEFEEWKEDHLTEN